VGVGTHRTEVEGEGETDVEEKVGPLNSEQAVFKARGLGGKFLSMTIRKGPGGRFIAFVLNWQCASKLTPKKKGGCEEKTRKGGPI